MSGAISPLHQYVFMAWCLFKPRDNFTLPLRFTRSYYWSVSYDICCQSTTSHPIYLRSTLISTSRSSKWSLLFSFSDENFGWISHLSHSWYMLPYNILLDLVTLIIFGKAYELWNFSLYSLLQSHTSSSILGTNILLSILFSECLRQEILIIVGVVGNTINWINRRESDSGELNSNILHPRKKY
jgi:hypothetical protein